MLTNNANKTDFLFCIRFFGQTGKLINVTKNILLYFDSI